MRHQGLQAAAEGEGGHHQGHRQHGAEQGGTHRHGGAAPARLEGEAHPDRPPTAAVPSVATAVERPRALRGGAPGPPGDTVGRAAIGERQRDRAESDDEHRQPDAEHRPVDGDRRARVDGTDRAERRQR